MRMPGWPALADPTGAAQKNAALWGKDLDVGRRPTSPPATSMRSPGCWRSARPTPAEQAATFSRFALFVQNRGWIGARCLDISKVGDGRRRAAQGGDACQIMTLSDQRKVTPAIGAEISGVDLAGPLSQRQASELHDALMAHQVIFFRDQQMSVEQHKAFGRLFGELLVHPAARAELEGHPEIRVVHADEKTKVATGEVWHSDMSCEPEPPMGSILYLHETPAGRRRHAVRQHVSRLRDAVGADQAAVRGADGDAQPARTSIPRRLWTQRQEVPRGRPSGRAHPSGDRPQGAVRQPRLHHAHHGAAEARERRAARDAAAPRRDAGVPVPLPLAAPLGGLLGQSLRACTARRSTITRRCGTAIG